MKHSPLSPSAVQPYPIASDGGMIYNPISREKADRLAAYDDEPKRVGTITAQENGVGYTLTYQIPENVTAYDAIPVDYEITADAPSKEIVHVGVTAFEERARAKEPCFDLTLPGRVELRWTYLGYVSGTNCAQNRPVVSASREMDRIAKRYPQYDLSEQVFSGSVKSSDLLWFRFAYKNTGNTILDGDGGGTFCVEAQLFRKGADGKYTMVAKLENLFNRLIDACYPGEEGEMYFTFNGFSKPEAGEYKIEIGGLVRNETANPEHYEYNMWHGARYTLSSFCFTITEQEQITEPQETELVFTRPHATRNRWLHRYEELMSSFDSHLGGVGEEPIRGRLYLQCAPFTEQITIRLLLGDSDALHATSFPITVESDSVKVAFNPKNENYVITENGTRFPAISAQSMADMRGNAQLGPDSAFHVIDNLLSMKEIGINLINTTAAFEFDAQFSRGCYNNVDACWFSLDVARVLGLRVQGWIGYPYESGGALFQANALFGTDLKQGGNGFGERDHAIAQGMNAAWQYDRWGDQYWVGGNGEVVMDTEDTRGWMRVDFNARHRLSEESKNRFRAFLAEKYGTIEAVNEAWETSYASFAEIEPEVGTSDDHGYAAYRSKEIPFGEWSLPLADLDEFRTAERVQDYRMVLDTVRKTVPSAKVHLRTEGANWLCAVDPATTLPHYRHVYYSQRRCGIVPEILLPADVLHSASDYTTLPYTPSEVAELTRRSVEAGVVPMVLPQFDRMRDIAINAVYGNDFTYEYNLSGETKGAYINTTCSVFEWYRAVYENGGVPGILWQDYLCDGYATATQRKEIAFFTKKLTEALDTPEGRAWASNFDAEAHTAPLAASSGRFSYEPEAVRRLVEEKASLRKQ